VSPLYPLLGSHVDSERISNLETRNPVRNAQDILEGAIARLHDDTQGDWNKFDDGAAKILFRARYHLQQQTCGDN